MVEVETILASKSMVGVETILPLVIGMFVLNIFLLLLFLVHRKYIGLWFNKLVKRNVGNELLIFDEENSTIETVFVKSPSDYGFGETTIQKLTETIPNNVINPVKTNKIPFIRDKNNGFPVRLFFRKSREEWNPFAKVPNVANREMRKNNYLNVWNTSAAYNRALGGGNFNKIVLIMLGLIILLVAGSLKFSADINDSVLANGKKIDDLTPVLEKIGKEIDALKKSVFEASGGVVGAVTDVVTGG